MKNLLKIVDLTFFTVQSFFSVLFLHEHMTYIKSSFLLQEHGSVLMEKHDRRSLSRESSLADIVEGIPPTFAQRPQTKICEEGK